MMQMHIQYNDNLWNVLLSSAVYIWQFSVHDNAMHNVTECTVVKLLRMILDPFSNGKKS